MNRGQMLTVILAEECAEVAQRCSKILRFGITDGLNETHLRQELNDLYAAVGMLEEYYVTDFSPDVELMQEKSKKVEYYMKVSALNGTLE